MMHTTPPRNIGTVFIEYCCAKSAHISVQIDAVCHRYCRYQITRVALATYIGVPPLPAHRLLLERAMDPLLFPLQ